MGRQRKYANDEERRRAAQQREYVRDIPRKLENARRRHLAAVRAAQGEGLENLLTEEEKGWV